MTSWDRLQHAIVTCARCPRLRCHCRQIAATKRAAFRNWEYWGKPVPNLGRPDASLLLVGLAPAAHGANRTGRMFTGDRSGDFLFHAMYAAGFANQPRATGPDDGLRLLDAAITGVAHCAPPDNKPTSEEIACCRNFFRQTVACMTHLRGVLVLGRLAFDATLALYRERAWLPPSLTCRPAFAHGALFQWPDAPFLLCSFHPSQQNTFTGRLTPAMMRAVFQQARACLESPATPPTG